MIYAFLADGFEECEALVPVDILRRGGIDIKTVGIGSKTITGSHGISVTCDICENDAVTDGLDGIILPGGMPGTLNLEKSQTVLNFIDFAYQSRLLIGAICAAPFILGHKGILDGKKATCFTGYEKDLSGAVVINSPVVRDENIITSYGAGASFDFGFELLAAITNDESFAKQLQIKMRYIK